MSSDSPFAPIDAMHDLVRSADEAYRLGRFNITIAEALGALKMWDDDESLTHSVPALELRDAALLLAYKASVAAVASTVHAQMRSLFMQRALRAEAETVLDAGSEILERIKRIDSGFMPLRGRRNRADDRAHNIVPRHRSLINKKKPTQPK